MDWSPHISAPEQVTYSAMIALRRVLCVLEIWSAKQRRGILPQNFKTRSGFNFSAKWSSNDYGGVVKDW